MASEPSAPGAVPTAVGSDEAARLDVPRRTSPWSIAYETVAVLGGLLFLVGTVQADWLMVLSVVSSVGGLVALVVRWRFRTYTLTQDRLLLDEGVVGRRNRVVPYARVQQVNLTSELLHRPLGLTAVHIEAAGEGGESTVQLRVLRRADAEALRAFVLDRRAAAVRDGDASGDGPGPAPRQQRQLGAMTPDDLTLAGCTHTGVLVALGVYALMAGPLLVLTGLWPGALLVVSGAVGVGLVGASAAVAASWLRNWKWTLTEEGGDFHVRRGLLDVRTQSWPRRRVQQVTVVDNPVRRILGRVSVLLHTAAAPGVHGTTVVEVPLVRRSELDSLLTALMGPEWVVPPLEPRPERARRRAVRRRALLLAVLVVVPLIWRPGTLWVMAGWPVLAWPWGWAAHRRAGAAATADLVVFASGVVHHRMDMAPRRRLQSTRTSSSPLQRRLGLATVHLDLAGTSRYGPMRLASRHFDSDGDRADELRRDLPQPG